MNFKGAAKRLTDTDLPRIGSTIGVGEDVLHAIIDVEAPCSGFDDQGRPRILFEPHIFYRELGAGPRRDAAVKMGLAYANWKSGAYGPESGQYAKLERAMTIGADAALRSCSWGRAQMMGFNCAAVGFVSARAMVDAFMQDEASHIEAMVAFIAGKPKALAAIKRIDKLTRPSTPDDWRPLAEGYNGAAYAQNNYHVKLAQRHGFWRTIPDTPWSPNPVAQEASDFAEVSLPVPPPPDVEPTPAPRPLTLAERIARIFKGA